MPQCPYYWWGNTKLCVFIFYKTFWLSYKFKHLDRFRQSGVKRPVETPNSEQPPVCSMLYNVYELSPRVSEHAPSRDLNPGLSLHFTANQNIDLR